MTLDPLYVHDPAEVSREIVFLSPCVMACRTPVPLCRSRRSVARNRLVRAEGAFRHRAPNPFAGGFPKTSVIFVQIPVMARPRASSCMPLCDLGEGCGAIRQVSHRCTCTDTGFRVGWGQRMPLYVFPMQPKDRLPGKSGDRAPRSAQSEPGGSPARSRSGLVMRHCQRDRTCLPEQVGVRALNRRKKAQTAAWLGSSSSRPTRHRSP